ncbi:hypothetical protein ABEB36_012722 [Hypothenemus hampei]|uniref:Large ribosomal subunit protein mL64 n=1 Tax=Hypothenemus hampei TaxID=57062 RepID=A0ABD1EC73_HYPHA
MLGSVISRRIFQITNTPLVRSTSQINIQKLESEQTAEVVEDDETRKKEENLQLKRNKSRLSEVHYRMLHEENPYPEPKLWHHGTISYMRKAYGKYGAASGFDPSLCWPIKEELQESIEYEKVKYPFTVPQLIEEAKNKREEKEKLKLQRQQQVAENMQKLEQWKRDLQAKIEKSQSEAMEAKLRKERLIEEVRRHFGYTVDPRDERFQELLEKKEKEQKKQMKEARKKEKEAKLVKKLLEKKGKEGKNEDAIEGKLEKE